MNVEESNPPFNIRQRCENAFNLSGVVPVFTVGSTIFNPSGVIIDEFILAHEQVHAIQQGENPAIWWGKYINDEDFRFEQELKAYRVQYRVMSAMVKDRNLLSKMLYALAGDLSGKMYGSMCKFQDALKLIKNGI